MHYSILLFDLDHTLLDFEAAEERALNALLLEAGVLDLESYKAYYKPMNKKLWRALEAGAISKQELVRTRFARLFAHFGEKRDGAYLAERYQYYLAQEGQTYAGASDLLEVLIDKGYALYAATNGVAAIQTGRLLASGLGSYFKEVFISEQLGAEKPSRAFFEQVAARIPDFAPELAVMIGDSLTADVAGGVAAGLDTIWYNPCGIQNQTSLKPTWTVASYAELLSLLEKDPKP